MICRNDDDADRAVSSFASCCEVIVERYLAMASNLCLNMAVAANGRILCLGCAEQVSNADGAYRGNWLVEGPPDETVLSLGRRIGEKAAALGYVGVFGADMCRTPGGRVLAFDLNFRINGSTAGLMVWESVRGPGPCVARSRAWTCRTGFPYLLSVVRQLASRGDFLPLAVYNPDTREASGVTRVSGLLTGETREDVQEKERELTILGLE